MYKHGGIPLGVLDSYFVGKLCFIATIQLYQEFPSFYSPYFSIFSVLCMKHHVKSRSLLLFCPTFHSLMGGQPQKANIKPIFYPLPHYEKSLYASCSMSSESHLIVNDITLKRSPYPISQVSFRKDSKTLLQRYNFT